MHGFARIITASIAVLALSACSSGSVATGGTATQGTSASGGGGGAACSTTTETTTVQAKVLDFMFDPASVTAKVGDVVTWSNAGPTGHTVTLDNGAVKQSQAVRGDGAQRAAGSLAAVVHRHDLRHRRHPRGGAADCPTTRHDVAQSGLENPAELFLEEPILVAELLLFAQSDRIIRLFPA